MPITSKDQHGDNKLQTGFPHMFLSLSSDSLQGDKLSFILSDGRKQVTGFESGPSSEIEKLMRKRITVIYC